MTRVSQEELYDDRSLLVRMNQLNETVDAKQDKLTSANAGANIQIVEVGGIPVISAHAEATVDHNLLSGRDVADCHPMSAVTGLASALDAKESASNKKTSLADSDTDYPTSKAVKTVTDGLAGDIGDLESAMSGKEDSSNKKTDLTSSDTFYPTCKAVKDATDDLATDIEALEDELGSESEPGTINYRLQHIVVEATLPSATSTSYIGSTTDAQNALLTLGKFPIEFHVKLGSAVVYKGLVSEYLIDGIKLWFEIVQGSVAQADKHRYLTCIRLDSHTDNVEGELMDEVSGMEGQYGSAPFLGGVSLNGQDYNVHTIEVGTSAVSGATEIKSVKLDGTDYNFPSGGGTSGITGIKMNDTDVPVTSGVANLGTVITAHQSITGKEDTSNKVDTLDTSTTHYPSCKAVSDADELIKVTPQTTAAAGATEIQGMKIGTTEYKFPSGGGGGGITGIQMNGSAVSVSGGIADLGTVLTSHQDISGKMDNPTNAATAVLGQLLVKAATGTVFGLTISAGTGNPSGGSDGDIYIKYTE